MPLWTTDALVLRRYDLGEADRVVVLFARDRGKKRAVARGARRPRSRFAGAFEPLTRLVVTCFEREGRELARLEGAEVVWSPLTLPAPALLGGVEYFAELLDASLPDADPNERLFRLAVSTTEALGEGVPVEPLARYFEYWLLCLHGVYPPIARCAKCQRPLGTDGAVLAPGELTFECRQCVAGEGLAALSEAALGFLRTAASTRPQALGDVPFDRTVAQELDAAHRILLAAHLDREVKSARVLRELVVQGNPS